MVYIREKKLTCGTESGYMEVDIIPRVEKANKLAPGERNKKEKLSRPSQINLNDKNSKRYMHLLAIGNFSAEDIAMTCTHEIMPETIEEAEKQMRNYLRRVAYAMKKEGVGPLKYILVTEYQEDEEGNFTTRPHHHLIINGGLDRDKLEKLWSMRIKGKGKVPIGTINTKRLQFDTGGNGLQGLTNYMNKPYKKKRWSSSRNLKRPEMVPDDRRYRRNKIESLALSNDCGEEFFAKKYPKYNIVSIEAVENKRTGWHIYLKMWKKNKGAQRYE